MAKKRRPSSCIVLGGGNAFELRPSTYYVVAHLRNAEAVAALQTRADAEYDRLNERYELALRLHDRLRARVDALFDRLDALERVLRRLERPPPPCYEGADHPMTDDDGHMTG